MKTELPPFSNCVLFFVLFLSMMYLYSSIAQRKLIKKQQKVERPKSSFGFLILWNQISLISFFSITYILGWDAPSVGLKFETLPVFSLIIGLICYCTFVLIVNKILKLLRVSQIVEDDAYLVSVRLIPREKLQRILFLIAVCILNPMTEELIFRGVLVHQLGIYINNYYLTIILGLFVTLGNHIYQGRLHIITHIIFYIFTVTLLYSDVGLIGSIGFHLAGDIYPFMWLKYQVNNYKQRRREERRAKYVSN
ncbi:MAG: CPBP family intramembrane metalloprotease [Nostoc sp. JL34]|uniref:CPBP family intramembrane glutamic endopeptidase n=1 Tax=Nostoc sp. JL34 TaxID=2815397 RepID=UPI001DDA33BF|nr:CPBP family intramembrane glutamic endopeptidase [Nostoc sp. JL34]MBN3884815.1 CPBP family intramembrane metalloprotease [Nostoc sp. JL34]